MEFFFRIYIDFLLNLICALLLFRMTESNMEHPVPFRYKFIFVGCIFLYSVPPHIPYAFAVYECMIFLFTTINTYPNIKKGIFIFIKYEIYSYASIVIVFLCHSLVFRDWNTLTSAIYEQYKSAIVFFLAYVFYVLYKSFRKNRVFHSRYFLYFNIVILAICLLQSYLTLYVCQKEPHLQMLPALFSTLIILIIVCISLYDRFIELSNENAHFRIQTEINRMQENYAFQTEQTLKDLRSIRHDIKNHLIIIDGYAAQKKFDKIHEYISKIARQFSQIPLIESPSVIVSSILNEKATLARQQNIDCKIECSFPHMKVDDFSMTTILGNLLDNAITAAGKRHDGWIRVSLIQFDSLLLITVDNNCDGVIREKDSAFHRIKTEQTYLHGIGLKNVQKAVQELNGQIEISHTEDTFHVKISLPNYK